MSCCKKTANDKLIKYVKKLNQYIASRAIKQLQHTEFKERKLIRQERIRMFY
jgi:hypothetical protein